MYINQAYATTVEAVTINEKQNLVVVSFLKAGECMKKSGDFFSVLQVAAGNFANYERVSANPIRIQQGCEACVWFKEVINPY